MKKIMIKNPVLVRFGMILVLALAISSIVSSFFLGSRMRQENVEMMEKTISVSMAPPRRFPNCRPMTVMTGIKALRYT